MEEKKAMTPINYRDEKYAQVRKDAIRAHEKMTTLANYTPFRMCDLASELGIEVKEEDIKAFVFWFDQSLKDQPASDCYHYLMGISQMENEFWEDTYVCRRNRAKTFRLREIKDGKVIRTLAYDGSNEFTVRNWNYENGKLIWGTIYPFPRERFLPLMMVVDQWFQELKEGDKDEKGIYDRRVLPPMEPLPEGKSDWQIVIANKAAHLFNPKFSYAEKILDILRGIHPDIEQIIEGMSN